MNISDIEDYIIYKKETKFPSELPQDHEIVQEVFERFGYDKNNIDWDGIRAFLRKKAPHQKYSLGFVSSAGNTITKYQVMDRYTEGLFYELQYKGITFVGYAHKDGKIESINHTFNIYDRDQFMRTNWHKMAVCETLEELYDDFLKEVIKSKRKTMNYYNKLIKDIKQDYKEELKRHNDILKGVRE